MRLIVGLGNPGSRYSQTRHNVGFMVVDAIARRAGASWTARFRGDITQLQLGDERVYLLKPQTYMNRSGQSVGELASYFKIAPEDALVVHDELDLPFGTCRLKLGGGEAGHNGLKSVSSHLGGRGYARLRVGIGQPPAGFIGTGADFVLHPFPRETREQLDRVIDEAADAAESVALEGLASTMNRFNQRQR